MHRIIDIKTFYLTAILILMVSMGNGLFSQSLDSGFDKSDYTKVQEIDIKVFPNPATDYVIVTTAHKFKGRYKLNNILGKVLVEGQLDQKGEKIDLLKFRTGIYIISIYDESGQKLGARKIIKN